VVERDGRLFVRKGAAYLAVMSSVPGHWREENEWNMDGADVVVVVELGSERENGSFDGFMDGFGSAELTGRVEGVTYASPSVGAVATGWKKPLVVNSHEQPIDRYPRFDNPWCRAEFSATRYEIRCGEQTLVLDAEGK
jgi:hypothetical protein